MKLKLWLRSQPRETSLPARRLFNVYQRRLRGGDRRRKYKKDLQAMEMVAQLQSHFQMGKDTVFTGLTDKDQTIVKNFEMTNNYRWKQVAANLYLLAKHKNDCTPLGPRSHSDINFVNSDINYDFNYLTWSAIWPDYLLDFHFIEDGNAGGQNGPFFPTDYDPGKTALSEFKEAWTRICDGSSEKRFIFIFLNLTTGIREKEQYHANVLIYDRQRKELEHFEPHGGIDYDSSRFLGCNIAEEFKDTLETTLPTFTELQRERAEVVASVSNNVCDGASLDRAIIKHLKPIIGFDTYLPASSFCPRIGFQRKQALKKIGVDPGGFCMYWSIYYIDLRLSNPDTPREELVQNAIEKIDAMTTDFGQFIRSYAVFMQILVLMILANRNKSEETMKQIMVDMIHEFTDDKNYEPRPEKAKTKAKTCAAKGVQGRCILHSPGDGECVYWEETKRCRKNRKK